MFLVEPAEGRAVRAGLAEAPLEVDARRDGTVVHTAIVPHRGLQGGLLEYQ